MGESLEEMTSKNDGQEISRTQAKIKGYEFATRFSLMVQTRSRARADMQIMGSFQIGLSQEDSVKERGSEWWSPSLRQEVHFL